MKIAFIGTFPATGIFPPEAIRPRYRKRGGHPAPWIAALMPELARLGGFELRLFLAHRSLRCPIVVERDGVEYEGVPCSLPERFERPGLHWEKSVVLRRAVRRFDPAFIHAFGFETGAALIAVRSGYPVSCFIQGIAEKYFPYYTERSWIDRHVGRWAEKRAVTSVRWMVAETEFARSWALKRNPGAAVALIPHSLRRVFLDMAAPTYGPMILTVGGLSPRKGVDTVIRAFAAAGATDARLVVAGGGPLRDSLEKLAAELGVHQQVRFTGALDTEAVVQLMNQARALVIASRVDTSPNVLSEAHAVGLPVIGTRAGGIPEMIEDGVDGFHVDVDDHLAMAEKLDLLLGDPDLARRMGAAGRERVRVLNDPVRIARAHVEFFTRIGEDLRELRNLT